MRDEDYTYAVQRIRVNELHLLNNQDVDQLAAASNYEDCMKILADKGWGDGSKQTAEELLELENQKTWKLIKELTDDLTPFEILLLPIDYNNLKAAIKSILDYSKATDVYAFGGLIDPQLIQQAIKEKDFSLLGSMEEAGKTAYDTFMQTQDGQLCDAILDRACLNAILESGESSGNQLLADYAELTVAISNIKIAVRSCKTGKSLAFIGSSIAPCKTLDSGALIKAAASGMDDLFAYLSVTPYAEAAAAIKTSYSAFEKYCDDKIMSLIKEQKRNPFSVGPLVAYVIARQNEIGMVRIILSAKRGGIDKQIIQERLRDMYV